MIARFLNITDAEYLADNVGLDVPTLSNSCAKVILYQTPRHAWEQHPRGGGKRKKAEKYMDFGQVVHASILKKGAKACVVDADSWRTNKAKEEYAEALSGGFVPMLAKDFARTQQAVSAILEQLEERGVSLDGRAEQPMIWFEENVPCRGKLDLFDEVNHPIKPSLITEIKTTEWSLTNTELARLINNQHYDMQAAAYIRGVQQVLCTKLVGFQWIFCEVNDPFLIRVERISPLFLELGNRKWETALAKWRECLKSGHWTGYSEEGVAPIEPPIYALRKFEVSVYPPVEVVGSWDSAEGEPAEGDWF